MEKWKCSVCGYVHEGPMTDDFTCPICKQPASVFVKLEEAAPAPEAPKKADRTPKAKFFICEHCGNLVGMIHNAGVPMICCGQKMTELIPNTVEASGEKHKPVVTVDGSTLHVSVGAVDHPMIPEHFIEWIYVGTEQGGQRKKLDPGAPPKADFYLGDDKATAVYDYSNLQGVGRTEV